MLTSVWPKTPFSSLCQKKWSLIYPSKPHNHFFWHASKLAFAPAGSNVYQTFALSKHIVFRQTLTSKLILQYISDSHKKIVDPTFRNKKMFSVKKQIWINQKTDVKPSTATFWLIRYFLLYLALRKKFHILRYTFWYHYWTILEPLSEIRSLIRIKLIPRTGKSNSKLYIYLKSLWPQISLHINH